VKRRNVLPKGQRLSRKTLSLTQICQLLLLEDPLVIAVMIALGTSAAIAEQIDNPMYGYWASFKPGSV
jgi:hypothetical protein